MKVDITKQQALAKLKEVAENYENMVGVKLTEEDAQDVIRAMSNKAISLDQAATEIVQGILYCLCREIA
jgi:hypothetical protein